MCPCFPVERDTFLSQSPFKVVELKHDVRRLKLICVAFLSVCFGISLVQKIILECLIHSSKLELLVLDTTMVVHKNSLENLKLLGEDNSDSLLPVSTKVMSGVGD